MIRRLVLVALVAAAGLAAAGCSQVAAISPVGGSRLAEVRFAVGDVLVREGIELLVAPVCAAEPDATIGCEGTRLDGARIIATAPGDDLDTVTITVDDESLYAGSIMGVLETAMEPGR